jgi:3-hydroxybutyryl-CoA dehydrogenase
LLTVAIIGAGPLGRRLALDAARAGMRVLLEDVMPATLHHAQEYIRQELSPAALSGEASGVGFVSSVEDAVREADLVIDCVPDELESKLAILWLLDRMSPPRTVIATPTTRLSISDLAGCTYRPEKCIAIAAEANELARGLGSEMVIRHTENTSRETIELVGRFWRRLGVEPRFEAECDAARAAGDATDLADLTSRPD